MKQSLFKIFFFICLIAACWTGCIEDNDIPRDNVTGAQKPVLSEIKFLKKTATTITFEGEVANNNGYALIERGICWGTSESLDIAIDSHKPYQDNNDGTFQLTIDNLQGGTQYYFCLYAVNKAGAGYGKSMPETTESGLGIVQTIIIQDSTHATTALVGGKIVSHGEGEILERGVYYAATKAMANKDSVKSVAETDSFLCRLINLKSTQTYYVQAYVKNSFGIFTGLVDSVITSTGVPILSNVLTVIPESNQAKVTGEVLSIGDAPIIRMGFCWTKAPDTPTKDTDTVLVVVEGTGLGEISQFIKPLEASQTYNVSVFAENQFGTGYSAQPFTFTTTSDTPSVSTLNYTVNDDGSVVVSGVVTDIGAFNVNLVGICYSLTGEPNFFGPRVDIALTPSLSNNDMPHTFSATITGLKGGVTYQMRAFALNFNNKPAYGSVINITTPNIFTQEAESFAGAAPIEGSSAYFVINDKGYILGGDIGPSLINNLWSFNPALANMDNVKTWQEFNGYKAGNMKWMATAVYDTRVYVLGGVDNTSNAIDSFYVYYSIENSWFKRSSGPSAAYSRVGTSLNSEVIYIGGMNITAKKEVWAYNVFTDTWTQKPDFPVNQYGGVAVKIGDNIYAGLGKNDAGVGNNQLWESSGALSTWTPEPVATGMTGNILAGAVINNKLYVIDKQSSTKYSMFEYNPVSKVWRRMSDLPISYNWEIQFMFSINNRIYIGFANTNKVLMYNPLWDN
ncbi:MAG: hypothetical protein LBE56_04265 [Tannerella sp.]|jgi:hypothetical protein|nr:hypothetical protein [Tannerella sp.]